MGKILCMDVANKSIRCVEMTKSKLVDKAGKSTNFELNFEMGMELPDPLQVQEFKEKLNSAGISTKCVVLNIHFGSSIERHIEVPLLKKKDLLHYLELNSEDYFPVSVKDYLIDAVVTETLKDKMKVKVTLLPKHNMDMCHKTLKMLGFKSIKSVLGGELPTWAKDKQESYISLAVLGNVLSLQYIREGVLVTSKSEVLHDFDSGLRGALMRLDDSLSMQFEISMYSLPVIVFGEEEKRNSLSVALEELFRGVYHPDVLNYSNDYESGYLHLLASNPTACKMTEQRVYYVINNRDRVRQNLIYLGGIGAVTLVVGVNLVLGSVMPRNELEELKLEYQSLEVMSIRTSVTQEEATNNEVKTVLEGMDAANNYFFLLIDELKEKMPSDFTINSINIGQNKVSMGVSLESKESCIATLDQLETLEYATAAEIKSINENEDSYGLSLELSYTNAVKEVKGDMEDEF